MRFDFWKHEKAVSNTSCDRSGTTFSLVYLLPETF